MKSPYNLHYYSLLLINNLNQSKSSPFSFSLVTALFGSSVSRPKQNEQAKIIITIKKQQLPSITTWMGLFAQHICSFV